MTIELDDATQVAQLHSALVARAEAEGILDVAYDEVDSPFGPLLVCSTEAGLVRVALPAEDTETVLRSVAERVSPRVLRAPRRVERVRAELGEYFEGRRRDFDLALDWRLSSGFRLRALHAIAQVPYGSTATYTEVATGAGNPRAVRAAGSACATNPMPIIVPCHRVLRTGGGLGGYLGGLDMKRELLALEAGGGEW
jgi:methylated-DNA-[protein]-cysteine S-methyltransferase